MGKDASSTEDVKDQETDEVEDTENAETTEEPIVEAEETEEAEAEVEEEKEETRENSRIRELVEEKNALSRAVDALSQRQAPVKEEQEETEEEIDPTVKKHFERKLAKKEQEFGAVVTSMAEKMDDLESRSTIPDYAKNKSMIEAEKNQYGKDTGRWISRFQAYANLLAKGKLDAPARKQKGPVLNKKKTRQVTETKSQSSSKSSSQKAFKDMTMQEKEAKLEGVKF